VKAQHLYNWPVNFLARGSSDVESPTNRTVKDDESMNTEAAASSAIRPLSSLEQLRQAKQIIQAESCALIEVSGRLGQTFCDAVECLFECRGSVIVSGMGKAGLVGRKIMATLASTGTRAHCLHPAEAVHGDLGRVRKDDVILLLSQSGQTDEVVRLLPPLRDLGVPIIAITARGDSTLAKAASITIELGQLDEACSLGLAPSASTTAMLAVGDALALVVSRMRGFGAEDFARYHPAGSLGQKLSRVEQIMRSLDDCRVASDNQTVRDVFTAASLPGRRTGAIMLVDDSGKLSGMFTDSDLARLFEKRSDIELDRPIRDVMTADPSTISVCSMATDAVLIMASTKISELPVVDKLGRPVGLIDITDVVSLLPQDCDASEHSGVGVPKCRVFIAQHEEPAA